MQEFYEIIQKKAFKFIEKSFEYDDILHETILGNRRLHPLQLKALEIIYRKADRLMEFYIEKPEQTIINKNYVITDGNSETLPASSNSGPGS